MPKITKRISGRIRLYLDSLLIIIKCLLNEFIINI